MAQDLDSHIYSLLAEKTPDRVGVRSSYIKKCLTNASRNKGQSYEEPNLDVTSRDQSMSVMSILSQGNEYNSELSGIYDMPSSDVHLFRDSDYLDFSSRHTLPDRSSILKEEVINTNTSKVNFENTVLLDVDPGTFFADTLSEEFLEFFLSYSGEHEIFDLLLNYENLCCKGVEGLSKSCMENAMTSNLPNLSTTLNLLQLERNTWRLLRILFQDRLKNEVVDEAELLLAAIGSRSDKQFVDNLYQREAYIRESQLIVDWLEKNADEDFQYTYNDKFEYFTDQCFSLEHSMNKLITSNFNLNPEGKCYVEMDPDAGFRQKHLYMHEADKENENRLFKFMFIYIRAGKLDIAQQLAEKFGEPIVAAILEGWRLFHDPNYENEVMEGQELLPVEGNQYRDLWKAAAWTACESSALSKFEQAVYGSLCGNLKSVTPVCKTWEDYLWIYVKTSLDKLIEQEIRTCSQQERTLEELPTEYWDKIYDTEDIFHELEACNVAKVSQDCKDPYHVIQKYIILDDLGGLIEEMYSWLNNRNVNVHILRFMTHIILFLRVVGRSTKEELCVPILEAYVQELIKTNKRSLVAPYTSTLPKEQQIMWYARFLEGISDNNERQKCIQYAEDAGLDVFCITETVVKNIREKEEVKIEDNFDLSAVTSETDLQKIHAIDWLLFNPNQRAEAVKQANALLRIFVAQKKLKAAKLLFSKIPADSVAVMIQLSKAKGYEELPASEDNATREYLCFKAYLEAMDAFDTWFHHSIHAKPKAPVCPSGDHVTFKEKVAHEHEMKQYEKDLNRWKDVVNMLGSAASDCLYNVLLFVDGGWMVDQRTDGTINKNRQILMAHLRKVCIPHVAYLLQDLLKSLERHKEAVKLADFISSERYQLYKDFTTDELKQFVRVALQSSFALLDSNKDPFGYNN